MKNILLIFIAVILSSGKWTDYNAAGAKLKLFF